MSDPVTAYAESVLAGETLAGPPVRAACQRHLRDLERSDLRFDAAAAQRVLDFFPEVLRLPKGDHAGAPAGRASSMNTTLALEPSAFATQIPFVPPRSDSNTM